MLARLATTLSARRMAAGTALDSWLPAAAAAAVDPAPFIAAVCSPPKAHLDRHFHASPTHHALGVVEQLHDDIVATHHPGAGAARRFWEVLEFRPLGTVLETWKTPEVLGLHPRDVHLFAANSGVGQRAMIAPRGDAILFRTEAAKAVIYYDRAVLFPARRLQDTVRVAQALKSALSQRAALPFELKVLDTILDETATSFEKKVKRLGMVAETILEDINRNFQSSAAELQRSLPITRKLTELQHDVKETLDALADVADYDAQLQALCLTERARVLESMRSSSPSPPAPPASPSSAAAAAKTPVVPRGGGGRSMTTLPTAASSTTGGTSATNTTGGTDMYTAVDTTGGATAAARSAAALPAAAAAPGLPRTMHMRMASRILEAYEHRMMGTQSALNELMENIEQVRNVWHMTLDHQRNRVLRINLLISISSLGGILATLPAAYFGMNLASGMEEAPGIFLPVVQGSLILGMTASAMMYTYYKFGPKRRYNKRLRDMRSLRDLLAFHIDDIEAIVAAVKSKGGYTSRADFAQAVRGAIKGHPISKEEVELLYRVFESNKEALLELSQLMKAEEMDTLEEDGFAHHLT